MKTNTNTRYVIFNKKTAAKTGVMKFSRKFQTRSAARDFKRSTTAPMAWGIYDVVRGVAIR